MRPVVAGLCVVGFLALSAGAIFFATLGIPTEPRAKIAPITTGTLMKEGPSPVDAKLYPAATATYDHPDDAGLQTAYALLLEQKAREVGNAAYHQMAGKAAGKALARDPKNGLAKTELPSALVLLPAPPPLMPASAKALFGTFGLPASSTALSRSSSAWT